jgi:hypothetical protein
MNKLENKLLKEASFYERMFNDIVQALFRPAARKFFQKISDDIDNDPKVAGMFQQLIDSKKDYERLRKEFEKMYPSSRNKIE